MSYYAVSLSQCAIIDGNVHGHDCLTMLIETETGTGWQMYSSHVQDLTTLSLCWTKSNLSAISRSSPKKLQ